MSNNQSRWFIIGAVIISVIAFTLGAIMAILKGA